MKLQHLTIIFIIIVLPLTLILSAYTGKQIDTINLQNQYDTALKGATYDGISAFEMNETYNELSTVQDLQREDVDAAVSTFMNSLAMSMGVSGYKREQMNNYIPAILFTLYDGYYIYSSTLVENEDTHQMEYEYMLKPYNYYTIRYKRYKNNNSYDIVVNYSLDNYMVVYGWIDGDYVVKSGYLVTNNRSVSPEGDIYKYVPYVNNAGSLSAGIYGGNFERINVADNLYNPDYVKNLPEGQTDTRTSYLYPQNDIFYIDPDSAINYYSEAVEFTNWVTSKLGWVTPRTAMRNNQYLYELYESDNNRFRDYDVFDDDTTIFNLNTTNNDPEISTSIFAQHKTNVIRTSIQDNLNQAITAFSRGATTAVYDFAMPKLEINEWDMISNNICMLTFMQGVPMGTKYYNNYALVKSTANKLYVDNSSMYYVAQSGGDGCYHKIDCVHLTENGASNIVGFSAYEYSIKRVKYSGNIQYYYRIVRPGGVTPYQACYYCAVDSNYTHVDWESDSVRSRAYYTTIAREKYNRYKVTDLISIE